MPLTSVCPERLLSSGSGTCGAQPLLPGGKGIWPPQRAQSSPCACDLYLTAWGQGRGPCHLGKMHGREPSLVITEVMSCINCQESVDVRILALSPYINSELPPPTRAYA